MLTLPSASAYRHTHTSALRKMREQTPDRCLVVLFNISRKHSGAEFRNRRKTGELKQIHCKSIRIIYLEELFQRLDVGKKHSIFPPFHTTQLQQQH